MTAGGGRTEITTVDREAMTNRHGGQHERAQRTGATLFLALAVVLAAPALSWGHAGPVPDSLPEARVLGNILSSPPVTDGSSPSPLALTLMLVATLGLPWLIRLPRRVAILALAVVLSVFAFESALHSVHHLLDRQEAAKCQVLGASHHLSGTRAGVADMERPPLTMAGPSPTYDAHGLPTPFLRPDQGRAPPLTAA